MSVRIDVANNDGFNSSNQLWDDFGFAATDGAELAIASKYNVDAFFEGEDFSCRESMMKGVSEILDDYYSEEGSQQRHLFLDMIFDEGRALLSAWAVRNLAIGGVFLRYVRHTTDTLRVEVINPNLGYVHFLSFLTLLTDEFFSSVKCRTKNEAGEWVDRSVDDVKSALLEKLDEWGGPEEVYEEETTDGPETYTINDVDSLKGYIRCIFGGLQLDEEDCSGPETAFASLPRNVAATYSA